MQCRELVVGKDIDELPPLPFVDEYTSGEYYYVRPCYDDYYKLVKDMLGSKKECVTVTGTPGVGKSIFYAYFFKRFRKEMSENDKWIITAAYEGGGLKGAIAFKEKDDDGVKLRSEGAIDAFLDKADGEKKSVILLSDGHPVRIRSWMQTVAFTNPNAEWMSMANKRNCTLCLPLWDLSELLEAAEFVGLDKSLRDDTIEERFYIFGGVVRECFLLADVVEQKKNELLMEIYQISSWTPREFKRLIKQGWARDGFHHVLHFVPLKSGAATTTEVASPFVVENLGGLMMKAANEARSD